MHSTEHNGILRYFTEGCEQDSSGSVIGINCGLL
jgi:hypothetical protein